MKKTYSNIINYGILRCNAKGVYYKVYIDIESKIWICETLKGKLVIAKGESAEEAISNLFNQVRNMYGM